MRVQGHYCKKCGKFVDDANLDSLNPNLCTCFDTPTKGDESTVELLNEDTKLNKAFAWEALVRTVGREEAKRLKRLYGLPKIVWSEPK